MMASGSQDPLRRVRQQKTIESGAVLVCEYLTKDEKELRHLEEPGHGHTTAKYPVQVTQLTPGRLAPRFNNQHTQTAFALPMISLSAPTTRNQHIRTQPYH